MSDLILFAQEFTPGAQPSSPLAEFFSRLDSSHMFVIALTALGCTAGVIIVAFTSVTSLLQTWKVANVRGRLIQDMLDRGLSPAEIEGLVALTSDGKFKGGHSRQVTQAIASANIPPAKPVPSGR